MILSFAVLLKNTFSISVVEIPFVDLSLLNVDGLVDFVLFCLALYTFFLFILLAAEEVSHLNRKAENSGAASSFTHAVEELDELITRLGDAHEAKIAAEAFRTKHEIEATIDYYDVGAQALTVRHRSIFPATMRDEVRYHYFPSKSIYAYFPSITDRMRMVGVQGAYVGGHLAKFVQAIAEDQLEYSVEVLARLREKIAVQRTLLKTAFSLPLVVFEIALPIFFFGVSIFSWFFEFHFIQTWIGLLGNH